jgi:hypothetical protein
MQWAREAYGSALAEVFGKFVLLTKTESIMSGE